jgi:hypothetical protein
VLPTYRVARVYDIHLPHVGRYVTASHCHGLLQTRCQDCLQVHRVGLLMMSSLQFHEIRRTEGRTFVLPLWK